MEVKLLKTEDGEWLDFLGSIKHDFYHLPGYLKLSERIDNGVAEAVLVQQGQSYFFLPYLIRELDKLPYLDRAALGLKDICSPYGYPGPLIYAEDHCFFDNAVAAWKDQLAKRSVVSAFIRTHPILQSNMRPLERWGCVINRGDTVVVDLTQSNEEIWRQTEHGHRQRIHKARRLGLSVVIDNQGADYGVFRKIYLETMDRIQAREYYRFSENYFHDLKAALAEHLWLSMVLDSGGKPLAAGLFTEFNGVVQFHLSGTDNVALAISPISLMLDDVRSWAKARGNRILHLGGGLGAQEDSLFHFKAGFSKQRQHFYTWQIIVNDVAYNDLLRKRVEDTTLKGQTDYFPGYRQ